MLPSRSSSFPLNEFDYSTLLLPAILTLTVSFRKFIASSVWRLNFVFSVNYLFQSVTKRTYLYIFWVKSLIRILLRYFVRKSYKLHCTSLIVTKEVTFSDWVQCELWYLPVLGEPVLECFGTPDEGLALEPEDNKKAWSFKRLLERGWWKTNPVGLDNNGTFKVIQTCVHSCLGTTTHSWTGTWN